jgi:hypothetical protein
MGWVGMKKPLTLLVMGAMAALAAGAMSAAPAAADNSDVGVGNGPHGPFVAAHISFSGAVKGGGGTRTVRVPATCWWEPISSDILLGDPPIDAGDPESVAKFFEWANVNNNGSFSFARLGLPSQAEIEDAINRAKNGEKITWYEGQCVDGFDGVKAGFFRLGGVFQGTQIGVPFRAFPAAQGAPEPLVSAETLAQAALNVLRIDNPQVDRNPQLRGVAATLVDIPTYFWLTNPQNALNDTDGTVGQRSVTATAGNATATLTATNTHVYLSSGGFAGTRDCVAAEMNRAFGPGSTDANMCDVNFVKASNGWNVQVQTLWDGNWEGVDAEGPQGGTLAIPTETGNVVIPVAESQAVVSPGR